MLHYLIYTKEQYSSLILIKMWCVKNSNIEYKKGNLKKKPYLSIYVSIVLLKLKYNCLGLIVKNRSFILLNAEKVWIDIIMT